MDRSGVDIEHCRKHVLVLTKTYWVYKPQNEKRGDKTCHHDRPHCTLRLIQLLTRTVRVRSPVATLEMFCDHQVGEIVIIVYSFSTPLSPHSTTQKYIDVAFPS